MNNRAIAILVVRLIGLYWIVAAVSTVPGSLSMLSSILGDPTSRVVAMFSIISAVWSLLVGVSLWYWSVPLGNLIGVDLPLTPGEREFPLVSVQTISVSLFGLFLFTTAVPDLLGLIISWLFPQTNPRYAFTFGLHGEAKAEIPLADVVEVAVRLAIGFWLMVGSHGIVKAIREAWKKERTT